MLPFILSKHICLLELFRPTREFLTHMETLSLPVKGCKFWLMLGIYSYWAARFLSVPHRLRHRTFVYNGHLRGPVTLTPIAERFAYSGAITACFYDLDLSLLGFEHPTFRLRGQRSNSQRPHRCFSTYK